MRKFSFQFIFAFCCIFLKCSATSNQILDLPIKVNGDRYNFVFGDGNFTATNIWSDSGEVNHEDLLNIISTNFFFLFEKIIKDLDIINLNKASSVEDLMLLFEYEVKIIELLESHLKNGTQNTRLAKIIQKYLSKVDYDR